MGSEEKILHLEVKIPQSEYDALNELGFAFEKNVAVYLHDVAGLIEQVKKEHKIKNENKVD